jgi:hypothetical protein
MKISTRVLIISISVIFIVLAVSSYGFFMLGKTMEGNGSFNLGRSYDPLPGAEVIYWIEYDLKNVSTDPYIKWVGVESIFFTNDLTRAQEYIPFTIIVPTYVPNTIKQLPMINGPLKCLSNARNEIYIVYAVAPRGWIRITEGKYSSNTSQKKAVGDEIVEIAGKPVMKDGNGSVFTYSSENLSFSISYDNIPGDEAYKVVESMMKQVK